MFRLIEPSSGQIQNTVPVQSMSAHIMGSHTLYKIISIYGIIYGTNVINFYIVI
jgi:hypothetical protein